MSSFLSPKAEVHTISSDGEFQIAKGRKHSQDNNNHNRHLLYQHHCIKMKLILRIIWMFGIVKQFDCLNYQLFLRNIRLKEEDKMKGKDYKQYLLGLVQDEVVQGGWSDPVSEEMFEKRRRECHHMLGFNL